MNPISYARYLTTYSTVALSRKLDISRQYISRLEQGLYDKPNNTLAEWAADVLNKNSGADNSLTTKDIQALYRKWQWEKRDSIKVNKTLRPCSVTEYDHVCQPDIIYYHKIFKQWREDYWITYHAFCVDMCLHPTPVIEYEEGKSYSMPRNLKKVMLELELIGEGFRTDER